MKVAAVTPIIGEFGYIVFDIQPKVRAFFRQQGAERRVVFASRALGPLFEEATEIIEPPADLIPTAPATMRSIVYEHWKSDDPERLRIDRLVEWARATVSADAWLEIPYFQGQPWRADAIYAPLESAMPPPSNPYIVVAARAREFDPWRNWPSPSWDELVKRVRENWKLDVRSIGRPPSTYFPSGATPQDVDEPQRLDHSICLLNNAICSISSNSGPTHLSLMAGCPTFAWGEPYLKLFMELYTNPLRTPCHFYPGGWDPEVDAVWKVLSRWREALQSEGLWEARLQQSVRLSMCMIARNSGGTIEAALKSIKPWVDEMVVVDTGSADETPAIAKSYGARVFHSPWHDSFSVARNESLRNSHGQWIFWMDSDDTIDEENGRKLRELANRRHSVSTMGYVVQVHCPAGADSGMYSTATHVDHIKLFRNLPAIRFAGRIHEQVLPAIRQLGGVVEWTDLHIIHSGSDRTPEGRIRKQTRDLRLLELELAEDPDNSFSLFNKGMTLIDMSRPEEALNALCRSLQLANQGDSHVRKIYALLAQAYSELNRTETALRTCLQALDVCQNDPELLFRKGVLEQKLGRLYDAERSFRAIIGTAPDRHFSSFDQGILGVKAWHNLAVLYEQQQRYELAVEGWKRVLEFDRTCKDAWRGLVDSLTAANDFAGLENIVAAGMHGDISSETHHTVTARLLVHKGHAREAAIHLKDVLKINDSMELLDEFCRIVFTGGLLDLAEWGLCELTRRCPQNPSALYNLSVVYLRRHNYTKAAQSARHSLALQPNHSGARQVLDLATRSVMAANAVT